MHASRGLGNTKAHVGTYVEHSHFNRRNVALNPLDERDHFCFPARVAGERMRLTTLRADLRDQWLQFVG